MSGWIGAWGNAATVTNLTVTGSEIISVNTSTDALRITQTGTGNALKVEDSANPDSTPFVVDSGGGIIRGHTTKFNLINPNTGGASDAQIQTISTSIAGSSVGSVLFVNNGAQAAYYALAKTRGTTIGDMTTLQNGDAVGYLSWQGSDGTNFIRVADIYAAVDATPGTNDMPGRLMFSTTNDGASSPTEKMRIDNAGNVYGTSGTTTMTNGFFYIPAASGAPSGVPTAISGRVPMYYDTTNNNFYVYNGAWKKVLLG